MAALGGIGFAIIFVFAIITILVPFFILRIRNEIIQSNQKLDAIITLLKNIKFAIWKTIPDSDDEYSSQTNELKTINICAVKEFPKSDSVSIQTIPAGTWIIINEEKDDWLRISLPSDSENSIGWINKNVAFSE